MRIAMLAAAALIAAAPASAQDVGALKAEGQGIIKSFAGTLVGELKAAMKEGGPNAAIAVCNERAPVIADQASQATGWDVARTSLKLRSPSNTPDAYELAVMQEFQARMDKGEKAADIAKAEIVTEDGKQVFRLTKAIPTGEPCLTCHGTEIKPEITAKLAELYPMDKATGFGLGDMRGIFSLKKDM